MKMSFFMLNFLLFFFFLKNIKKAALVAQIAAEKAALPERPKRRPAKPLVLLALNEASQTYLIVGVNGGGRNAPNVFGQKFKYAASQTKALIRFHSFDASVLELAKADVPRFIDHLTSLLTI